MSAHLTASDARRYGGASRDSVPRRTLVVEFVGLPGSGKTTVANELLPLLIDSGVRCRGRRSPHLRWQRRLRAYASTAAFHLRHPGSATASVVRALTLTPLQLRRIPLALRMAGWARHLKQPRIANHDLIVLDQGIVQDAWSLLLGASEHDDRYLRRSIQASLGNAAVRTAYVYFDIEVDVAVDRIRTRVDGTSRFDRMEHTDTRAMLHAYRTDLERCLALAIQTTRAPSCRIDASGTREQTSRVVLEFILDLLGDDASSDGHEPEAQHRTQAGGQDR